MVLSATRVKALREAGRHSDGGGLHLFVGKTGHKSWVLRVTIDGRRRDIGLGGFPSVSLAQARAKAADHRAAIAQGRDPVAESMRALAMPTFREAAHTVHEANRPRWRNDKHSVSWMQTLERHAMPRPWQHAPGSDRPRGRAACSHPDMDDPAGDGSTGAATDADHLPVGHGSRLHVRATRPARPSTVRCPRCRR